MESFLKESTPRLAKLKKEHNVDGTKLRIRFRAPVHDKLVLRVAEEHGVQDMVEIMPQIPYAEAISEMVSKGRAP